MLELDKMVLQLYIILAYQSSKAPAHNKGAIQSGSSVGTVLETLKTIKEWLKSQSIKKDYNYSSLSYDALLWQVWLSTRNY